MAHLGRFADRPADWVETAIWRRLRTSRPDGQEVLRFRAS